MSLLFGKGGCSRPVLTVFLCAFVAAAVPLGQGAYGQYGPFLEKGIGAGVGVSETDNTTTLGTRIGYAIDRPIEIGLEAYYKRPEVRRWAVRLSLSFGRFGDRRSLILHLRKLQF